MRCRLIRLASVPFTSRLAKFGWVTFAVCNAWQRSKTQNLRRMIENSSPIVTRLWTKYFSTLLPDCLCHVSFTRYSELSLEVVKPNKCKSFWPPILLGGMIRWPRLFYGRSTIYYPPFAKVWLSFVSWSPSAKPGNEIECVIYVGLVKMTV